MAILKAPTVCQPYASLIAGGMKRVENRKWATDHRGPILILAGKSLAWMDSWEADGGRFDIPLPDPLPLGAIVARAELVACVSLDWILGQTDLGRLAWLDRHPHVEGPWCWVLERIERIAVPIPYRGAQGLFGVGNEGMME